MLKLFTKSEPSMSDLHIEQPTDWIDKAHKRILEEMLRRGLSHLEKGGPGSGWHGPPGGTHVGMALSKIPKHVWDRAGKRTGYKIVRKTIKALKSQPVLPTDKTQQWHLSLDKNGTHVGWLVGTDSIAQTVLGREMTPKEGSVEVKLDITKAETSELQLEESFNSILSSMTDNQKAQFTQVNEIDTNSLDLSEESLSLLIEIMLWDELSDEAMEEFEEGLEKGGPGSGHHGHKGISGQRGGSLPKGVGRGSPKEYPIVSVDKIDDDVLWWVGNRIDGFIEGGEQYRVYHATSQTNYESIKNNGLNAPEGTGPRWYMVTTSFDSARTFASYDDPVVIEYRIPTSELRNTIWNGIPMSSYNDVQHGIRGTLESKYIYTSYSVDPLSIFEFAKDGMEEFEKELEKGGPGSGHHGHKGTLGSRGGSLPGQELSNISGSLNLDELPGPRSKVGRGVRNVIDAIDSVHSVTELPEISVRQNMKKTLGGYTIGAGGIPKDITISSKVDDVEMTMAHEVGHFLDHKDLGDPSKLSSASDDPPIRVWRETVMNSQAVKDLNALRNIGTVQYAPDPKYPFIMRDTRVDPAIIAYSLRTEELFARSYAQYIATKSGNNTMISQLNQSRSRESKPIYYAEYWDDSDFTPISTAFDNIFLEAGWLK